MWVLIWNLMWNSLVKHGLNPHSRGQIQGSDGSVLKWAFSIRLGCCVRSSLFGGQRYSGQSHQPGHPLGTPDKCPLPPPQMRTSSCDPRAEWNNAYKWGPLFLCAAVVSLATAGLYTSLQLHGKVGQIQTSRSPRWSNFKEPNLKEPRQQLIRSITEHRRWTEPWISVSHLSSALHLFTCPNS